MDSELRTWTQRQDLFLGEMAKAIGRQADQTTLLARELASIASMLAPKGGPSALEELLAQLVAQGRQTTVNLAELFEQGHRVEAALYGQDAVYSGVNGVTKATV